MQLCWVVGVFLLTGLGAWAAEVEVASVEATNNHFTLNIPSNAGKTDNQNIEDENIKWLPEISHVTRVGLEVTITLSKTDHEEDCFLQAPEKETVEDMRTSVVEYYGGSEFVSCRVVIGPMPEDESLIGDWTLCGRYTEDSVEHVRCQPVTINWNNPANPRGVWETTTESLYNYVVNYGKTLTPAVREPRDILTCHVITPNGEDIVVTQESDYPGLTRVPTESTLCSIAIGPIHAALLGYWTIYGIFISRNFGTVEQRRPMHLYLYDEDNPYNQAYNVTDLNPISRLVNMDTTIEMQVSDSSTTNDCYAKDPSDTVYTTGNYTGSGKVSFVTETGVCRIFIGPITEDMLGDWQLTGKFWNSRGSFIERRQPIRLIKEDPANPAEDIPRTITYMTAQRFETKFNASHTISISGGNTFTVTYETCHLITPYKLQYTIMEGFNVPGVEVIEDRNLACGVIVHVDRDENVGEWTLMSREIVLNTPTEKRLPFTIYVEEDVPASTSDVTIGEGNDFYLRLANPTEIHDTCKLTPPYGNEDAVIEIDDRYPENCGYIVRGLKMSDGGEWRIVYGHGATYVATSKLTVVGRFEATNSNLVWVRDRPVYQDFRSVDPSVDTIYCRIQDPSGFVVFEGFGQCYIFLDRARTEHSGVWMLYVWTTGHITTSPQQINVVVTEAAPKAVVTTNETKEDMEVLISCSVSTDEPVRACKFRDPHGGLLVVTGTLGDGNIEAHLSDNECGLRLKVPANNDLGIWRCAMETDKDTYYGFMLVLCDYAMAAPGVAERVVTEPVLQATTRAVSIVEGETAVLSCAVPAPIRYCYFRARNGTVFSVSPDSRALPLEVAPLRSFHQNPPPVPAHGRPMPDMEYVGAGFDAGECGMRIPTLRFADTGDWTCHVGFVEFAEPEQIATIILDVQEEMAATQAMEGNLLEVQAMVHGGRQLDYCRFVRMDGFGFTSENMPDGYMGGSLLSRGLCRISMRNPSILEIHPWTVVARVSGQDFEISRQTPGSFPEQAPPPPPPPPTGPIQRSASFVWLWVLIAMLLMSIFFFGILLGPKRNRQWTSARARGIRNSFRSSTQKRPLPDNHVNAHIDTRIQSHTDTHINTAVRA